MRDITADFSSKLFSDAVWVLYDTAQAIASILSDNLNITAAKNFLEANVSVVSDAVEAVELLVRLLALVIK